MFINKKQDIILLILIINLINDIMLINILKFLNTIQNIIFGAFKNQIIQFMVNLLNPTDNFITILF